MKQSIKNNNKNLCGLLCSWKHLCLVGQSNRQMLLFEPKIWARIYQASQSAILVLSAENLWNVLLLSNLSIKASYQIS